MANAGNVEKFEVRGQQRSPRPHKRSNDANMPALDILTSHRSGTSNRTATRCSVLFTKLDFNNKGTITSYSFLDAIESSGIRRSDPRIEETMNELKDRGGVMRDIHLSIDDFLDIIRENTVFVNKIFGKLIVQDWKSFRDEIENIYREVKMKPLHENSKVSSFTPDIARMNPNYFSICICTIDGQRLSIGDSEVPFTLQGLAKPISYLMALQENGMEYVAMHVGTEPSGDQHDSISLKKVSNSKRIPHNPIVDPGAIMVCSLIKNKETMALRFGHSMSIWSKLVGGGRLGFDNPNYLCQKSRADRPWCLAYLMNEHQAFPEETDLETTLDFYFQNNAIEITNNQLAVVAATLANGGTSPFSGEIIFNNEYVRNCLSILLSSGMYQHSGRWSFEIGVPAKASCSGGLIMVVPNKMGIAVFSPRIAEGMSSQGAAVCRKITEKFSFHQYDILKGFLSTNVKVDPCKTDGMDMYELENLLFAAAEGDLKEVQRAAVGSWQNLLKADYDNRTALHLAASEGHHRVVKFIVEQIQNLPMEERIEKLTPKDRWQRTPLDDAHSGGHKKVIQILEEAGAKRNYNLTGTMQFRGGIIRSATFLKLKEKPGVSSSSSSRKSMEEAKQIESGEGVKAVGNSAPKERVLKDNHSRGTVIADAESDSCEESDGEGTAI